MACLLVCFGVIVFKDFLVVVFACWDFAVCLGNCGWAVFGGGLLGSVVCAVLVVVFADFGLIIVHACSWVCFVMLWVWRFGSVVCAVLVRVGLALGCLRRCVYA